MGNPLANEKKAVSEAALEPESKSVFDSGVLRSVVQLLLTLIGWLLPKAPGKLGLQYHKLHVDALLQVLGAVSRAEPADRYVSELEANVNSYVAATSEVVARVRRDIPPSPFANFGPAGLLAPLLVQADPGFVDEFNRYLDTYQQAIEVASTQVQDLYDQGRQMEASTPARLQEIRAAIDRLPEKTNMDLILKKGLRDRLEWVEFTLMTRVQNARSSADDTMKYLQVALGKLQKVQRL
jgi:hypothetical protein